MSARILRAANSSDDGKHTQKPASRDRQRRFPKYSRQTTTIGAKTWSAKDSQLPNKVRAGRPKERYASEITARECMAPAWGSAKTCLHTAGHHVKALSEVPRLLKTGSVSRKQAYCGYTLRTSGPCVTKRLLGSCSAESPAARNTFNRSLSRSNPKSVLFA